MFIKTADGSYINAARIKKIFIDEDDSTKTFDVCARLDHDCTYFILAGFEKEFQAQAWLDDLVTTLNEARPMTNEQLIESLSTIADDVNNARCEFCDVINCSEHQDALRTLLDVRDRLYSVIGML